MKINTRELVGRKLTGSNRMLVREAYRRGVEFEILPKKRFRMTYGEKSYLVRGGVICHAYNTKLARRMTDLKDVTSRYLRAKGHPAPENIVFLEHELERAWNWAKEILPVVLKPHNGIMGKLVYVNIDNYNEFKYCFEKIAADRGRVLIEEFVQGNEYRFTYVNGEIVAIANRVPANVVGDGKNTIRELVEAKNEERDARKNKVHKKLVLDEESERVLLKQGYTFDSIPDENIRVYLRNNSNIATGGDAIDVTDSISDSIKEQVRKALKSIPGLRVCGTDVLIHEDSICILEINAHPMLNMHHFPWEGKKRDVVGKVIDAMFPETIKK